LLFSTAFRTDCKSTSPLKGFVRNSTAPAFMAWTVMGISPWPVTKMIGIPGRSTATLFCKSRPLSPGSATSRTRQFGTKRGSLARKSWAETIGNSGRRGEDEQKENGSGIGLGNTAKRLKTLYGTDFEFFLVWPDAGGCEVLLELPLRRVRNLEEASPCGH